MHFYTHTRVECDANVFGSRVSRGAVPLEGPFPKAFGSLVRDPEPFLMEEMKRQFGFKYPCMKVSDGKRGRWVG